MGLSGSGGPHDLEDLRPGRPRRLRAGEELDALRVPHDPNERVNLLVLLNGHGLRVDARRVDEDAHVVGRRDEDPNLVADLHRLSEPRRRLLRLLYAALRGPLKRDLDSLVKK